MTHRALGTRLAQLEDQARSRPRPVTPPLDEDGWLATFERLGGRGTFDAEPDFPTALAYYRDALARAHASIDPPFDPPADFRPDDRLPFIRLECWRTPSRFPDVCAGLEWLSEMLSRVTRGVPPVTEAEFHELAAWFRANDDRLHRLSLPTELLVVGSDRRTWCSNIRFFVTRGPRVEGAGQVAEDIRQLKARYPEHSGG
jgi:hypothetical protein